MHGVIRRQYSRNVSVISRNGENYPEFTKGLRTIMQRMTAIYIYILQSHNVPYVFETERGSPMYTVPQRLIEYVEECAGCNETGVVARVGRPSRIHYDAPVRKQHESDKQHRGEERCAACFCCCGALHTGSVVDQSPLECSVRRVVIARGFVSRRERNNHPRCLRDDGEGTQEGPREGWKLARRTGRLEPVTPRPKV